MRRRTPARDGPVHVSAALEPELERLGEAPPVPLAITRAWDEAVGDHMARWAGRPVRLKGSTLLVRATTSTWINEFHMRAPAIIERLQRLVRSPRIEALRFELGELPAVYQELPRPPPPFSPPKDFELPDHISQALETVDDADTREAIRRAIAMTLAKGRQAGSG